MYVSCFQRRGHDCAQAGDLQSTLTLADRMDHGGYRGVKDKRLPCEDNALLRYLRKDLFSRRTSIWNNSSKEAQE